MAKKLFQPHRRPAQRRWALVKEPKHRPPSSKNQQSGTAKPTASFWALLTDEDPVNPGPYSFDKQVPRGYELVDSDPPFSDPEFTAMEVNLVSGLSDQRMLLTFAGYDNSVDPPALCRTSSPQDPVPRTPVPTSARSTSLSPPTRRIREYPFAVTTL